jgi:flagellar hook-basal body complex protein FliE
MVMNIANALAAYRNTTESGAMGKMSVADTSGTSFSDTLKDFVGDAVKSLKEGEQAVTAGATGKTGIQDLVMAVNNAEMMMTTVTALRDKVIGAYKEIMGMPI